MAGNTLVCSIERVKQYLKNYDSCDDGILQNILNAAVDVVEKEINRTLAVTSFDRVISGNLRHSIFLSPIPVVTLDRITCFPQSVLQAKSSADSATLTVNSTGVILKNTSSGTATTTTLLFATYSTLSSLQAAINGVSTWSSNLVASGTLASADLKVTGSYGASQQFAGLYMYATEVTDYDFNPTTGEVFSYWRFSNGYQNYRFQFTSGYSTVPESLIQAVTEIAANIYKSRNFDSNVQSESFGSGVSYTVAQKQQLSIGAQKTLDWYRVPEMGDWRSIV